MRTNTTTTFPVRLGQPLGELMALLQRRQELETRFRRAHGEERQALTRKLAHVGRLIQAYFR